MNISPVHPYPPTPVDWRDIQALRKEIQVLQNKADDTEKMLAAITNRLLVLEAKYEPACVLLNGPSPALDRANT